MITYIIIGISVSIALVLTFFISFYLGYKKFEKKNLPSKLTEFSFFLLARISSSAQDEIIKVIASIGTDHEVKPLVDKEKADRLITEIIEKYKE